MIASALSSAWCCYKHLGCLGRTSSAGYPPGTVSCLGRTSSAGYPPGTVSCLGRTSSAGYPPGTVSCVGVVGTCSTSSIGYSNQYRFWSIFLNGKREDLDLCVCVWGGGYGGREEDEV